MQLVLCGVNNFYGKFMEMLHEKFGQMALILPDVCESY